jgi:hypothetical protein
MPRAVPPKVVKPWIVAALSGWATAEPSAPETSAELVGQHSPE